MIKNYIILFFCAWIVGNFSLLSAQDLSGTWKGKLYQKEGAVYQEYDFELSLLQKGNYIQGFSRISVAGQFAEIQLEGTKNGDFVEFREIQILQQKVNRNISWCIKRGLLMLSQKEGYDYLNGNWTAQGNCPPGTLWVSRLRPAAAAVARPDILAKQEEKENKQKETPKDTLPASSSIIPTGAEEVNSFQGRITTERQEPIHIKNTELIIEIWDHKEIDGDSISLYLNETLVLEHHLLQAQHHRLLLNLDNSQPNFLLLYAHNLGEVPPNTVAISIDDGHTKQVRILRSDLAQSEVIQLYYEE